MFMNSKLIKLLFPIVGPQLHHHVCFFFFFSSPFLIPQNMGPLDFSVKWHMAAIKSPVFRGSILSTCFLLSRGFWSYLPAVLDLLPLLIFSPFSLCSLLVALGIQHTHFNHNIQHQSRTFSLGHLTLPSSFLLLLSNPNF